MGIDLILARLMLFLWCRGMPYFHAQSTWLSINLPVSISCRVLSNERSLQKSLTVTVTVMATTTTAMPDQRIRSNGLSEIALLQSSDDRKVANLPGPNQHFQAHGASPYAFYQIFNFWFPV
jgi:hypothetical protein